MAVNAALNYCGPLFYPPPYPYQVSSNKSGIVCFIISAQNHEIIPVSRTLVPCKYDTVNKLMKKWMIHNIFQGWFSDTEMYYGYYTSETFSINTGAWYNMKYAYLFVCGGYYILCMIILAIRYEYQIYSVWIHQVIRYEYIYQISLLFSAHVLWNMAACLVVEATTFYVW